MRTRTTWRERAPTSGSLLTLKKPLGRTEASRIKNKHRCSLWSKSLQKRFRSPKKIKLSLDVHPPTSLLASSTAWQEPGPIKQGLRRGREGGSWSEGGKTPATLRAPLPFADLDSDSGLGGGTTLDAVVARQLDHSTLPHWAPGPCRFLTQIPASTTDICYPRKRCDMGPNGFSVCSFLTLERPSRKTKYVYEKGQAPHRENVIQHHCSFWLQRVEGKDQKKQSKPRPGRAGPRGLHCTARMAASHVQPACIKSTFQSLTLGIEEHFGTYI